MTMDEAVALKERIAKLEGEIFDLKTQVAAKYHELDALEAEYATGWHIG